MLKLFQWYFSQWWKIMVRPIYFYTYMERGDWKDQSLSFLIFSSWLLSFFITLYFFYSQILSIILFRFLEGITGIKYLSVLPVLIIFSLVFFVIFYVIVGGLLVFGFALAAAGLGSVLLLCAKLLGGKGTLTEAIKSVNYSTAANLFLLAIPLLAFCTRFEFIQFRDFLTGSNIIMFLSSLYLWGLWSIAIRKVCRLSKIKSLCAAFIVFLLVLLLEMYMGIKILPKIERFLV